MKLEKRQSYNVAIGREAGSSILSGSCNFCIGAGNDVRDPNGDGQFNIYGLRFRSVIGGYYAARTVGAVCRWLVRRSGGVSLLTWIGNHA